MKYNNNRSTYVIDINSILQPHKGVCREINSDWLGSTMITRLIGWLGSTMITI